MARGIKRMFAIALSQYRRALDERSVLDFSDVLQRALDLLRQMDEFAQSRYPSRIALSPRAGRRVPGHQPRAMGAGLAAGPVLGRRPRARDPPSIFIVGDRKQSIYRFRDAEVAVLQEAGALHRGAAARGQPAALDRAQLPRGAHLLAFVNDAFTEMSQPAARAGRVHLRRRAIAFRSTPSSDGARGPVLGIAVANDPVGLRRRGGRRDRADPARGHRPRSQHRRAPGRRRRATSRSCSDRAPAIASSSTSSSGCGIPTYVYKGLGLLRRRRDQGRRRAGPLPGAARARTCARPRFLRSRFVRLSDAALAQLAPRLAAALTRAPSRRTAVAGWTTRIGGVLLHVRDAGRGWLPRVDRVPPADLLEQLLPRDGLRLRAARAAPACRRGRTSRRSAA